MSWWAFILVSLAAFRTTRLVGWDTILDGPRDLLTKRSTATAVHSRYRPGVDKFLHCAWCLGFWVALAWWGAWELWPHATTVAATPFAIGAIVGVVAKNLDP